MNIFIKIVAIISIVKNYFCIFDVVEPQNRKNASILANMVWAVIIALAVLSLTGNLS